MVNTFLDAFFADLESDANLDQFVQDQREEDLHLEFKQKADSRHGNLDDPDRRAFSKAVSGFANADGGILLFGVETKKSQDSPDRVCALRPITNADRFQAKLLDSILNTTQPPVDGVRIEVISVKPGEGYVKCLIPASDMVPHRAMLADREYWRRTSNGFRRMEHYELAEVFGRRLRPVLRLKVELRPRPDQDPYEEVHFYFLNEGRGLARHTGFVCTFGEGIIAGVEANRGLANVSGINANQPVVSYYNHLVVVHPNGLFNVLGHAIIQRPNKGMALPIEVKWFSENMEPRSQSIEIEPSGPKLLSG